MPAYIVAYDLNHELRRPPIVAEVKTTAWAKLSESSYAISTNERPSAVMARFKKHLDDNDNLYVISLRGPWSGFGPKAVIDWLIARIGKGE